MKCGHCGEVLEECDATPVYLGDGPNPRMLAAVCDDCKMDLEDFFPYGVGEREY